MHTQRLSSAFTRIDLLLVIGTLALMALVKVSAVANSKGPGQSAICQNNLRQLGTAVLMYSSENGGYFPARSFNPSWAEKLRRYYRDLNFLRCPSDGPNPRTYATNTNYPGDAAPRSYIYNGWDDYFLEQFGYPPLLTYMGTNSIPEAFIKEPSATITIGEKRTESFHFYMDMAEGEGNDLGDVEHGRHSKDQSRQNSGGSNYAFADGSARFLRFGEALTPTNLWAVMPDWRTSPF